LEEREVLPVGGVRAVPVDVRFVSATNRPLDAEVAAGRLRADLSARLVGFRLTLPPLRERREDLGLLCATLVERPAGRANAMRLSRDAARAMLAARWSLNVRALAQSLATAWTLTAGERPLTVDDFADALGDDAPAPVAGADSGDDAPADGEARKQQLDELLTTFKGNLSAVARALGRDRVLVRRWLVRYGLDAENYRR